MRCGVSSSFGINEKNAEARKPSRSTISNSIVYCPFLEHLQLLRLKFKYGYSLRLGKLRSSMKMRGGILKRLRAASPTPPPIWSQVLTPRDRMFTGEVNSSDYA